MGVIVATGGQNKEFSILTRFGLQSQLRLILNNVSVPYKSECVGTVFLQVFSLQVYKTALVFGLL